MTGQSRFGEVPKLVHSRNPNIQYRVPAGSVRRPRGCAGRGVRICARAACTEGVRVCAGGPSGARPALRG